MVYSFYWLICPILYALGITGASLGAISDEATFIYIINAVAGILLPLRGVWYIILAHKNSSTLRPSMLIQTGLECLLSLVLVFLPDLSYPAFLIFLALYCSFHAVVQGINSYIYGKNRALQYFIPSICQTILFLQIFACLILLSGDTRARFVIGITGYLLSMLGHAYLCDWFSVVIKNRRTAEMFRKISVTMPGFSGLGIPTRLISTIRNHSSDKQPDAEIIFNYGKSGKGIAGHCELCVDGKTYTYGNYDPESRAVLNTMGNGIIFRAEKKRYIDFLVGQNRTVVVYGLKFDENQRKYFRQTLELFEKTLISWRHKAEHAPSDEYIHLVVQQLDAEIYLINDGRFKTYFLPTINCVTLTSSLLRGTPAGNVVMPGVYTPGSYMDALHRLYITDSSTVISVNTYNQ